MADRESPRLEERFERIWREHKGKLTGSAIGLVAGIMIMNFGLFWAIFIMICAFIGYLIGRRLDESKEDFLEFLDRYLPPGQR